MATFYAVPQRAPTALSLTHTNGNRGFTVSWTGGRGNGGTLGCAVQVQLSGGLWSTVGLSSCDTDAVSRPMNLLATMNWYGASWSSVPVRLVRSSNSVVLGTFPNLSCTTSFSSTVPTPTIDENCDSTWDDFSCSTWNWVSGTIYPVNFTACTNVADTTASKACAAANAAENRYTNGMTTTLSPALAFSSSSYGTGCQGAFTGATQWTCTGSSCTYH